MRADTRFGVIEQAGRDQCIQDVGHHLAGHSELNGKIGVRRQRPPVLRGNADKVEPPAEMLVRQLQQLWVMSCATVCAPPASAHAASLLKKS